MRFIKRRKTARFLRVCFFIPVALLFLGACDFFDYGKIGGADQTYTYGPGSAVFDGRMEFLSGVWFSRYAGIGLLDGYRIGRWSDFDVQDAAARFPGFTGGTYTGSSVANSDYFLLYDASLYGNGGGTGSGFCGIVRAVNIFNGDPKRGALIIEYLENCAPEGNSDVKSGRLPFYGIYFRELSADSVQMANAVNLAALYSGAPYHTETKTLDEAVAANGVENEAEFISWGAVIPQNRENQ